METGAEVELEQTVHEQRESWKVGRAGSSSSSSRDSRYNSAGPHQIEVCQVQPCEEPARRIRERRRRGPASAYPSCERRRLRGERAVGETLSHGENRSSRGENRKSAANKNKPRWTDDKVTVRASVAEIRSASPQEPQTDSCEVSVKAMSPSRKVNHYQIPRADSCEEVTWAKAKREVEKQTSARAASCRCRANYLCQSRKTTAAKSRQSRLISNLEITMINTILSLIHI